jgi:tetratricopeptide (TPR) repeat protein
MRQFYVDQGQLDKAVESARLAADAAAPEDRPEALLDLASFLAQQGKREDAREILQRVEKAVQEKLAALGLEVLTLENATPENMKRRSEILQLRTRAREELAALDGQRAAP